MVSGINNRGKVIDFPDSGTLYVGTDFHGNLRDFSRFVSIWKKQLEKDPDTYMLILGDSIHGMPSAYDCFSELLPKVSVYSSERLVNNIESGVGQFLEKYKSAKTEAGENTNFKIAESYLQKELEQILKTIETEKGKEKPYRKKTIEVLKNIKNLEKEFELEKPDYTRIKSSVKEEIEKVLNPNEPFVKEFFDDYYADESVKTMDMLIDLKERYPENIGILQGNHENSHISDFGCEKRFKYGKIFSIGIDQRARFEKQAKGKLNKYKEFIKEEMGLIARAPCGLLFSHTGPVREPYNLNNAIKLGEEIKKGKPGYERPLFLVGKGIVEGMIIDNENSDAGLGGKIKKAVYALAGKDAGRYLDENKVSVSFGKANKKVVYNRLGLRIRKKMRTLFMQPGGLEDTLLYQLLWTRGEKKYREKYGKGLEEMGYSYLKRMRDEGIVPRVAVYGHTPIESIKEHADKAKIRGFVAMLGKNQLVFSSSFGTLEGEKVYLKFDLSRTGIGQRYSVVNDIREGIEIQKLY